MESARHDLNKPQAEKPGEAKSRYARTRREDEAVRGLGRGDRVERNRARHSSDKQDSAVTGLGVQRRIQTSKEQSCVALRGTAKECSREPKPPVSETKSVMLGPGLIEGAILGPGLIGRVLISTTAALAAANGK